MTHSGFRPSLHGRRTAVAAGVLLGLVTLLASACAPSTRDGSSPTPDGSSPTPSSSPGEVTHTPGRMGSLAYGADGDVYVADWDGSNPVRIANGVAGGNGRGPAGYHGEGSIWSPDGRYLAFRGGIDQSSRVPGHGTVYVSDPKGHRVTSFPGEGWVLSWSPDSLA